MKVSALMNCMGQQYRQNLGPRLDLRILPGSFSFLQIEWLHLNLPLIPGPKKVTKSQTVSDFRGPKISDRQYDISETYLWLP